MVVSALALTVSLANPHPAGAVTMCGHALDCVAAPVAAALSDSATLVPGNPVLDLDRVNAVQDAPPPDPAGARAASDTVAVKSDEASEDAPGDENVIVVEGATEAPAGDPAEKLNAATFQAVQKVDSAIVEPIAQAYDKALPVPIRKGLRNFLRNLGEPITFINFMLQMKPGKAMKALGRFAINTTIGMAGLFDVASKKPFNIAYQYNGLANTLGYYGVGPGPYLYLPFIGATSLRDLAGRFVDLGVVPWVVGKPFNDPFIAVPISGLTSLESRIDTDTQIDAIREKCGDPYAATRDLYLIQRKVEIDRLRGRATADLGEMKERLEFNCDIEIETGAVSRGRKGFVETNTTLLEEPAKSGEVENPSEGKAEDATPVDTAPPTNDNDPVAAVPEPVAAAGQ